MSQLPSRWAIHRRTQPREREQFAGADDSGDLCWLQEWIGAFDFTTKRKACDFVTARMGIYARDARIVRHTIH